MNAPRPKLSHFLLAATLAVLPLKAELQETSIEWKKASGGAIIEVVHEGGTIRGVRALAAHSLVVRGWTIHYVDGQPVTAEFHERKKGKIETGDRAGEDSGVNPLTKLVTFKAAEGKFRIADKELAGELDGILGSVSAIRNDGAGAR